MVFKKYFLPFCILLFSQSFKDTAHAVCFEEAGQMYAVAPQLLLAIADVENPGRDPNAIHFNKNGSFDFGIMQINSFWADKLGKDGWDTLGDPCQNVKTGAWILAQCIQRLGQTWNAIGCYNATTPSKRIKYAWRVFEKLKPLEGVSFLRK